MVQPPLLAGVPPKRFDFHLCTLELAAPVPHILASRASGMGSLEMVQTIVDFGNELIASAGSILLFHDFSEVTGYRSESRRLLVDWGVRNPTTIEHVNVLFRSKIVAMGVAMASGVLGGRLTGYSDYGKFDTARASAIANRHRP